MQCYLGIDGGGSGSRWALLDASGKLLRRGIDGPALQAAELGVAQTGSRVSGLIKTVASELARDQSAEGAADESFTLSRITIGLAGVGDAAARGELQTRIESAGVPVTVLPDTVTGAAAALADGEGVAVFAGTGSFAIARDADGSLHRVGGRGREASDHGSGYWIVLAAAESALLATDGLGPETVLESVLAEALGVSEARWIGIPLKEQSLRSIASRFPHVVAAADGGDAEALRILREGAHSLARLASAAVRLAGLSTSDSVITLGGGTTSASSYFAAVESELRRVGLGGTIRSLPMGTEQGAAMLARAEGMEEPPLCNWFDG